MAPQPDISLNNPKKPSKLLALIALVIAFSLPFVLVKMFPHKTASSTAALPVVETIEEIALPDNKLPTAQITTQAVTQTSPKPIKTAPAKPLAALPAPKARPKPVAPVQAAVKSEWKIIKTRNRDSLASVFTRAGVNPKILKTLLQEVGHTKFLTQLKPDQEIQLLLSKNTLEKMIVPFNMTQYMVVSLEKGHYRSQINTHKMNSHNHFLTATVYGSLYTTAKNNNIPYKLIRQMTEIFTWDINFTKDIRAGDQFTIVYKAYYIENKLVSTGDIVAVSYKNRGKVYQAVRHTNRAGRSDYYTPQGQGLKKAFNRYPVRFSHISSTFSLSRYHPILHYNRAHKGVDLAASIGTPIQSTGDGTIEYIGRQSGYGNMIKIKHNKTYSSIYGHMLKFQKGLSRGSSVKRGQVIGYVGQTGLASGPHCHYEFHENNQPRNPATINLPRGESISGRELATFKANTNSLLSQLKLYEQSHTKTRRG